MPFRMVFANPFVLAAVTVVAIGVIAYQILNKKRIPVRGGRGGGSGGPYGPDSGRPSGPGSGGPSGRNSGRPSGPGNGGPSGPDSGRPSGPDSCSGRPGESKKTSEEWTVNTSDDNGKVKACNNPKSEKPNEDSSVIRRRNVATTSASASDNMLDNHPYSFTNSFDENSDLNSDLSNENSDTAKQINKTQETKSKKTFVANISDDDSDSSESNASLGSNQNDNMSVFSNESNCSKASSSTTEYKKRKNSSSVDSSEELYKRKVCNYLKNNINKDDSKEKTTDDELLESSLSVDLDEPSTSSAAVKPVMCKGCLEEFANAVAYPCQHCYLCLDCAFKVHRIYKKCSICQSVVKTFEQLKM